MKVLLLSPFFFPETISTGKYNNALAKALVEAGIGLRVVASCPLYPEWRPRKSDEQLPGMVVHRAGASIRYPKSQVLRRLILELWFTFHVLKWTIKNKDVHIIVAVFPPSLFFYFVSILLPKSIQRVGIVHDLQGVMYSAQASSLFRRVIAWIVNSIEKRIFSSCDKLILLSHSMARKAKIIYSLDDSRVEVCYPFVSIDKDKKIRTSLVQMFEQGCRHVVYSGALGDKQNPEGLMQFFMEACKIPGVVCHIISRGPAVDGLKSRYTNLTVVRFHDLVDEEDLEEMYARSDVQVIPQVFETAEAAIPSKLPNVMASGAAILAICGKDSELAEIVRDTKAGISCNSWDPKLLVEALGDLLKQTEIKSREERVRNAEAVVKDRFSIDRLVSLILGTEADRANLRRWNEISERAGREN